MTINTRRIFVYAASLAVVGVASFTSAQATCSGNSLCSPLNPSISNIPNFFAAFLRGITMIALPIISLFFMYAGFLFVSAGGNESKLKKAKLALLYTIMGAVLILGAWILANLLGNTATQLLQ